MIIKHRRCLCFFSIDFKVRVYYNIQKNKRGFFMEKLFLGADYYPEDWDFCEIDEDIRKMKETGLNVVRIAEFAWSRMEPKDGEYNFGWLREVMDKLNAAGIKVILGTPSATPPKWLYNKYPEMAIQVMGGNREMHGGRRHCCSSNPDYIRESLRIAEAMAKEFGEYENLMGWQIDNEIYPFKHCYCRHCMDNFHKHLKEKYGSVENVNKSWNLTLFSQEYGSIEDIPAPIAGWHNPHIKMEWQIAQGINHMNFVHMQAEVLRKYTSKPIGTDTMPFNSFDYRQLNGKLDVAQFNHYNTPATFTSLIFWLDYMRGFSKIPLWNTETQATWNGATSQGMGILPENFIYMNSFLPFMEGGSANLYWLWRTHWAGHELQHGALLDSDGRYTHTHNEIVKVAEDRGKAEDFLTGTKVVSDSAIMFQSTNWNIRLSQTINDAVTENDANYTFYFGCALKNGVHPDVIDAYEELDKYKLIFSPFAFTLDEGNFEERITKWVNDGGVWVVGPLSDIRTKIGTKYKNAPYGFLEKLTGIYQLYMMPDDNGTFTTVNNEGETVKCSGTYEIFEDNGEKKLITVTEGHSAVKGKACALEVSVGKGKVIVLGTIPEEKEIGRIIKYAAELAGADRYDVSGGLLVTKREGKEHNGIIVASTYGAEGEIKLEGKMKDVVTGKIYEDNVKVDAYKALILEKI